MTVSADKTAKRSKRIDQFRRDFVAWIDDRLATLETNRQQALRDGKILYAGGIAMRMDELQAVKSAVLPMTR